MAHWRAGKLPPERGDEPDPDELVRVVDKLPKVPPSQIVFLRYDPDDQSGGNYWRWNGRAWEPQVRGTLLPAKRRE